MLDLNSKINISEEDKLKKNETIRISLVKTREKRKHQECKVYQLKIDESKLNKQQKEYLKMLFVEAKRYKNWLLNQKDVFSVDARDNIIYYLDRD